jgi:hypothetical protein
MECPNCGHQNSGTSSYCSECAAPLKGTEEEAGTGLNPADIVRAIPSSFAGIVLRILWLILILVVPTIAIIGLYDLFAGHRLLAGLGRVFAIEGVFVAISAAFGVFYNVSDKMAIVGGSSIPPAVFYNTLLKPVVSAVGTSPRPQCGSCLVLAIAGIVVMILGLLLLG